MHPHLNCQVHARIWFKKNWSLRLVILLCSTMIFATAQLRAATVGPGGYTNAFGSQPPAADWATISRAGAAGDTYDSDTDVNANVTSVGAVSQTTPDAANPPAKAATAVWSSSGFYLQTRPTGNRFTSLMGKFVNNTGTNATQIGLSYLFTITGAGVAEDSGKGTRVYYSLTGAAGGWTNLAALNTTVSANASAVVSTNVSINWTNGAALYLLWVDDNANAMGDDSANQIDGFSLQVTAGAPLTLAARLTSPGSNAVLVAGAPLSAAATIGAGTGPFSVEYFTNSGAGNLTFASAGTSGTSPFTVGLAPLPAGLYNIYAVVTDSAVSPAVAYSTTNTFFVADPIAFALTAPLSGAAFDNATDVAGSATVSGGTAPYSVQFYLDNTPSGAAVTAAPYERNFGMLFVGDHAIRASVTDANGWTSNSIVSTVHITGPLGVIVTPSNGTTSVYGQPVTVTAVPGGGTGPYSVSIFTNDQLAATFDGSPYTTNLGVLAVGTHAIYARVTDSSSPVPQQNSSLTNILTILPNPLTVSLTNPTNGQSATAGQTFSAAATAAVLTPLTVGAVEFFFDGNSAGVDSSSPYSVSITNPTAGNHLIYAVATDSLGRTTSSSTNSITFVVNPLANNNFANRFTLGTPASVTANNVGATTEGGEPSNIFGGGQFVAWGATLWWKWVAPVTGTVTIDTFGSGINTFLGVYTGNAVNGLTVVSRNDNAPGSTTYSLVSFNATQGQEYQIQVAGITTGFGGGAVTATGPLQLNLTMPPAVTLTSPTNGNVFFLGTNIFLSANATSVVGSITRVDFYRGGTFIGTRSNSPYALILSNAPPGTNSLFAVAADSAGQIGVSTPVNVLVASPGITIISPGDGAVLSRTDPITVSILPLLTSGAITNVDFFVDGQKFGQDSDAPFSAVWSSVTGGSHRLTATGLDDAGNIWVAAPVNLGVARLLVASNSVWKYLDDGTDQGTGWRAPSFDDDSWLAGPAPLGYGDSSGRQPGTTNNFGPDANNKYITTYFRQSFSAINVASYTNLVLNIQRDDGAIVYLNGVELSRFNMPSAPVTYTTFASANAGDDGSAIFSMNLSPSLLNEGLNFLAVEVHQDSANSSDIWFELDLLGIPSIIRNFSPLVSLSEPTNTTFFAPTAIYLSATASDPDGSIAKVEFFANGVKIGDGGGSANTNSFTAVWNNPPLGAYVITAVATDNQNATTISIGQPVVIYDSVGTPLVEVTSPASGLTVEGPTNLLVTATAHASSGLTNVQFLANGIEIGNDSTAPYSVVWSSSFLSNGLVAVAYDATGARGTSAVVVVNITIPPTNVVAPTISTQLPPAFATVTNLTNIAIVFSERVQHVDASDLLINGLPATGVTGSGSNYVFTFPQPPYGEVEVAFTAGHGITDFGFPYDLLLNELDATASWEYNLVDKTPPVVLAKTPAAGSTVTNLTTISVTFSESVTGVDAGDLLVNGTPAFALSGGGSNYVFNVAQPPAGAVSITWAISHGITDQSPATNAFNRASAGATWLFILDSRTVLVQSNSTWRYLKGVAEASFPADSWRQPGFDDSTWTLSPAPFLFGETTFTNAANPGTDLGDMANNGYSSVYFRKHFTIPNAGAVTNLLFNHQTDDGLIAWINGIEVLRYNMPTGAIPYNGSALTTANESGGNSGVPYILVTLTNAVSAIVSGNNTLAVQAFNVVTNPASSDFVFNAQLYTYISDAGVTAPRVATVSPTQGDLFALTNITVTFSEGVSNVDAGDFLVNGIPASSVSSSTNTTYQFTFSQPAYGLVTVTWAANHGISDFDDPAKPFDGAAASSILHYTLVNPSAPTVVAQTPAASLTLTGLTSITVTFSEPVGGVDASDLIVNGAAAGGVTSTAATDYTFTFAQPAFGTVTVRWATNHGIADLEAPSNPFDTSRPGNTWNYSLVNPRPSVTLTSPSNGVYILAPADITLRATASDNDGTVSYVEFYAGTARIGAATNSPYTFVWSAVPEGTYTVRAVATDDGGLTGTSAPVVLNIVTSLPVVLTRGPYLQMGSSTGAVVRWRTDQFSDAIVRFGLDPDNLTNAAAQAVTTNEHIVSINGLKPDTKYFYSIGSASQRLAGTNGTGSDFWFNTAPVPGTAKSTRFWALGDSGTANASSRAVRDAYYNFAATNGPADIWLMLGDNAYNSGTDNEHQAAVFDMYPTILRNKFLWTTLGNHETAQSTTATEFPYLNIFSLPQNGEAGGIPSGTEKYYSFDYANIHFVCLDSMTSGRTGTSPMAQWLRNDLAGTSQDWIVAFFHHPPYTKGSHDSDAESDLIDIRANLVPILEANGVDLVLNGHSHVHERSYLLNGHYGQSSSFVASMKVDGGDGYETGTGAYRKNAQGLGVVYVVAGSSGQTGGGSLNHPAHFVSLNELGSMVVDVSSNRLDAMFLNTRGGVSDHFTLLKAGAPQVPVGFSVYAIGTNEIQLAWNDVGNNELGYIIERSFDGTNFTRIATNGVDVTSYIDTGLVANTRFYYRIRAFNAAGESDVSIAAGAYTGNTPPFLPPVPDYFISVLTSLRFTNTATDADIPTNRLTYSLNASAPTNAHINPVTGVFSWRPNRSQAPGTNTFTVRVEDDGSPALSATRTFNVFVNDYIEASIGSTVLLAGTTSSVPMETFSSADLLGLQCVLQFSGDRLTNVAVEMLAPASATVALQLQDVNTAVLTFTAAASQTIQGTQQLARLHFTALPGQVSSFIPLRVVALGGVRSGPGLAPSVLANSGRAAVIGQQPLVESLLDAAGRRELVLFGKPNVAYQIESTTNAALPNSWLAMEQVTMTNLVHSLPATNTSPVIFFRVRE
ncbi:MAG: acid phosphatase type 7 [Verrucomicrobiota bacterium]|jgi:hypothetical protein